MSGSSQPRPSPFAVLRSCIPWWSVRTTISTRRTPRHGESGYVDIQTTTQGWSQWAGQKIWRKTLHVRSMEEVILFPGWASRHHTHEHEHESEFDLLVSVSGYATTRRPPEFLTRSQQVFLKLAKGYASLARLPNQEPLPRGTAMIEVNGLKLPPRPEEIADDFEMQLDKKFEDTRQPEMAQFAEEQYDSKPQSSSSHHEIPPLLQRQHTNLEERLRPFWSSALPSRTVQICIFAMPHAQDRSLSKRGAHGCGPLLTEHLETGPDGAFTNTFRIPWRELSKHPLGRHQSHHGSDIEHELLIAAKLLPEPAPTPAYLTPAAIPKENSLLVPITSSPIRVITDVDDTVKLSDIPRGARTVFHNVFVKDLEETKIPEMGSWYQQMWKRGVRFHYVSNSPFELLPVIKEFLQISDLPPGSIRLKSYSGRSFFNNLLSDPATRKRANVLEVLDGFPDSKFILIGDTGERDLELYASVASERPQQILAVFIRDVHRAGLTEPTGVLPTRPNLMIRRAQTKKMSLPLKSVTSYPPILRTMSDPELLADSGTNAVFTSTFTTPPQSFSSFDSPASASDCSSNLGVPASPRMSVDSMNSAGSSSSTLSRTFRRATGQSVIFMTEAEKKRLELQTRVNKAKLMMESHIVLRVFIDPQECTEMERLLEPLNDRNG